MCSSNERYSGENFLIRLKNLLLIIDLGNYSRIVKIDSHYPQVYSFFKVKVKNDKIGNNKLLL